MKQHNDISSCIYAALETYFKNLDGEMPAPIYDMVIRSVEGRPAETRHKPPQCLASTAIPCARSWSITSSYEAVCFLPEVMLSIGQCAWKIEKLYFLPVWHTRGSRDLAID